MFLLPEQHRNSEAGDSGTRPGAHEEQMFLRLVDRFLRKFKGFYEDEGAQASRSAVMALQRSIPELYRLYSDWHGPEDGTKVLRELYRKIDLGREALGGPQRGRRRKQALGALRTYDLLDSGISSIFFSCYPELKGTDPLLDRSSVYPVDMLG